MKDVVLIFLVFYGVFGLILFVGSSLQLRKEKMFTRNAKNQETIQLSDLTVIIPFRNERERIEGLLQSINKSSAFPHEIIFIDDHSEDETSNFITTNLRIDKYQLLDANKMGKKSAIAQAIQNVNTDFVLTLDADVTFESDYFEKIGKLQKRDLLILPVVMKGKGWRQLFEIDVDFTNAVNYGVSGLSKPIVASGANLLFSKVAYEKWNKLEEHQQFASGDDLFLLNNVKKNNGSIQLIADKQLAVMTSAPFTFKEYVNQRLRWISKTSAINDSVSKFLGFAQILFTVSIIAILIALIVQRNTQHLAPLIFLKCLTDFCATMKYYFRIGKVQTILPIAVNQIWTPILFIVLAFGMLFYKPTWKGREVKS